MTTFTTSKNYNNQFATAYIVYMMGGSYFKKCECKNKHEEKRLFLHYAEMPKQKQLNAEDGFLRKLEKLNPVLLAQMAELKSEVHFWRKDSDYNITFQTGGFGTLECKIKESGEVDVRVGRY